MNNEAVDCKIYEMSFCCDQDCIFNIYGKCFSIDTIKLDGIYEVYTCSGKVDKNEK